MGCKTVDKRFSWVGTSLSPILLLCQAAQQILGEDTPLENTASSTWLWQTDMTIQNRVTSNSTNPHQHVLPKTKCVDNGDWGEKERKLICWNCVVSSAVTSFSSSASKQSFSQNYHFTSFILSPLQTLVSPTSIIEEAHWMHLPENSLTIHFFPQKRLQKTHLCPAKKPSITKFILWTCILLVSVLTALVGVSQIPTDTPAGTKERAGKVSEEVQQPEQPGNTGCSSESWAVTLCQEEDQAAQLRCH